MKKLFTIILSSIFIMNAFSQHFEENATQNDNFELPKVSVGADFAMQFQGLNHHADSLLIPLGHGINLPTANFSISALLADGIEVNVTTYLSSRHHVEAWVKGGYLLIDKLPFIKSQAINRVMDFMTFKVGVMEINYGDVHFRRSDNGNVINNMFVGNYILDAFTTAPAFEALFRHQGILLMGAITTGTLKPALSGYSAASKTYTSYNIGDELAFYWKAGYDKNINDDFRVRATISGYHTSNNHFGSLYYGDRTGSRYYLVMNLRKNSGDDVDPAKNHMSGTWGPGFTDKNNSIMLNLYTWYKGFEIFGTYENTSGTTVGGADFKFKQYALEGLFHFGKDDQFFGGARYNYVTNNTESSIDRLQFSGGWFITPNILLKAEYVNQDYTDFVLYGSNAGFKGFMFESTISF